HSPGAMVAAWPTIVTRFAMSARLGSENAEAVVGVLEGDPLDEAGKNLLGHFRLRLTLLNHPLLTNGVRSNRLRFHAGLREPMNRMNLSALSGIEATLWRKSWRTPKQLVDGLDQLGFDLLAAETRRLHRRLDPALL